MNKIGWCDMTWNPVWGCLNHCEYCYARGIAKRFRTSMAIRETVYRVEVEIINPSKILIEGDEVRNAFDNFNPTFLYSQFDKKFPKKPQRIFVGSMSEIYYWDEVWIQKVIDKIKEYPQHTFQFLTKFSRVYNDWVFPKNCWLGMTITKEEDITDKDWEYFYNVNGRYFFSIEPFLDRINPEFLECIEWVIIGAETGNRKGKVIPKREWIEDIVLYCKDNNIPVYLKDSLKDIYPVEIKEFPKTEL